MQMQYYEMKVDNSQRKIKRYTVKWNSCFGLLLNYVAIFVISCSFMGFLLWIQSFSKDSFDKLTFITKISSNNDMLYFRT